MKRLLPLFMLCIQHIAFTQETIFQDNLFNNPSINILIQDSSGYRILKFNKKKPLTIYTWKYETLRNAFITEFASDPRSIPDSITSEVGRIFYAVLKNERIKDANVLGPSAGSFGFEKKEVPIQRSEQDYRWSYKTEVKAARKYFYRNRKKIKDICKNAEDSATNHSSKNTSHSNLQVVQKPPQGKRDSIHIDSSLFNIHRSFEKYNNEKDTDKNSLKKTEHNKYLIYKEHFLLDTARHGRKISDTRVTDILSYCPKKLRRKALKPFYEQLSQKIDTLFTYYIDPRIKKYEEYIKEEDNISKLNSEITYLYLKIEQDEQEKVILYERIKDTKRELDTTQKLTANAVRPLAEKLAKEINHPGLSWKEIMNPDYYYYFILDSLLKKKEYERLEFYLDRELLAMDYRDDTIRLNNLLKEIPSNQKILRSYEKDLDRSIGIRNTLETQLDLDNYSGVAELNDLLNQQKKKKEDLSRYNTELMKFVIDSIEVEVSRTFIENIVVYGKADTFDFQKISYRQMENKNMTFYNHVPLGISTLTSIEDAVNRTKLYGTIDGKIYEMNLGHVMAFYRPKLQNYRTDLSPADTTFTLIKNNGLQEVKMRKTPTKRLFEMRVYSDFVGLNGKTPNGLVQTEVSKEMYLNSKKSTWERKRGWYMNFSAGAYITPYVILSKLEQTNKHLQLYEHQGIEPPNTLFEGNKLYATTVQLKRYENFSAGTDLNLFYAAVPRWKTQFYLDPGLAYGRTGVRDSIPETDTTRIAHEYGVNTVSLKMTLKIVFQTDERYFFDMRIGLQWLNLINDKISQTQRFDTPSLLVAPRFDQKTLFTLGLNAGFSPTSNTNGKLFFRYNYYGLVTKRAREGFSQIQLGYSYYLKN